MLAELPRPGKAGRFGGVVPYLGDRHRRDVALRIRVAARDIGVAKTPGMAKITCGLSARDETGMLLFGEDAGQG
jgi:hypothetical protein